jgi:nitroimidazol reductase NimA-like FMN-containing flavoprotein (pyridoxamine 5'-phosphate oxidase superfamily)
MRRKEKEIKELTVLEEILRDAPIGRLGVCTKGKPYVVPMNFAYNYGSIYLHSHRKGKKMRIISENPLVCFEVDEGEIKEAERPCSYGFRYRSVIVEGTIRVLEVLEEKLEGLKLISEKYAPGKAEQLSREDMENIKDLMVLNIEISKITGKKSG